MKVTFVGGGSLVWGTDLLTDMALNPPLHGATVALQDIDQAALDLMARMGRKISTQAGASFRFETAMDLAAAVSGADVVVDCVGIGGWRRCGRTWRSRPGTTSCSLSGPTSAQAVSTGAPAHPAHRHRLPDDGGGVPGAWLLILSNPVTQLTRAATRESSIRTIGICHEILHTRYRLAASLGLQPESLWFQVAGINHLPWITEWRISGRTATPSSGSGWRSTAPDGSPRTTSSIRATASSRIATR